MWLIQEPKKVALWNKRYFEEKNGECAACLKNSVLIVVEKKYIKCNIWRVAVRPSYIQNARFLKINLVVQQYSAQDNSSRAPGNSEWKAILLAAVFTIRAAEYIKFATCIQG